MEQDGDITPLDACVFGMSITPPEYGRNVTASNRLEYFEDHFRLSNFNSKFSSTLIFRCILYLIAAGSNPMLTRLNRLRGGFFYHLIENMLTYVLYCNTLNYGNVSNLKEVHANQISDPLQYGLLVVLEAFWIAG